MKVWSVSLSYMKSITVDMNGKPLPKEYRIHGHFYIAADTLETATAQATVHGAKIGWKEIRFECVKHLGDLVT